MDPRLRGDDAEAGRRKFLRNRQTEGMTTLFHAPYRPVAKRVRAWPESGRRLSDRAWHRLLPRCSFALAWACVPSAQRGSITRPAEGVSTARLWPGPHTRLPTKLHPRDHRPSSIHAPTIQTPSTRPPSKLHPPAHRPNSCAPTAPSPPHAHHTPQPAPTTSAPRTPSRQA